MTNILLFFFPRTGTETDVPADVSNSECLTLSRKGKSLNLSSCCLSADQVEEEDYHLLQSISSSSFLLYSGNFLSSVFEVYLLIESSDHGCCLILLPKIKVD